jgi:putative Holliday junction resolvase
MTVMNVTEAVQRVAAMITELREEEDGLDRVVVGMPSRLDGSPTASTPHVLDFIDRLRMSASVLILTEDERLTSREAESLLALNERDWRKRKEKLDAAAAAVILQDYLDRTS